MSDTNTRIFTPGQADPRVLHGKIVAVIGYGNQGRAQALNLRDKGVDVIIGNRNDRYKTRAVADGFTALPIPDAVAGGDFIMLLLPDELLPDIYRSQVAANLSPGALLSFASGYTVAFDLIDLPPANDVILVAPRMIGVGVRERFLTKEGFYCLVGVHQDASGAAQERLLALTDAIGGLLKPAIEVTLKQEAVLDLFNEQAFGPAFGRVLLTSISVLVDNGIPPEAALVEMVLSEEMAYTYQQMAQVGLVKQTLFHSHTSQYGAMSRALRFLNLDLKTPMRNIYAEIESGAFAREWQKPRSRLLFRGIRFFAMRQFINKLEARVRDALGLPEVPPPPDPEAVHELPTILNDPDLKTELAAFQDSFEF